jgi:poly(beta-D-mannuronate) lyase
MFCLLVAALQGQAKDLLVSTPLEISAAMLTAMPGDTLTMSAGTWRDARIVFQGNGLSDKPIVLRAPFANAVVISGASSLRIAGSHLVVSGLTFTGGYSPSDGVIEFRGGSPTVESHHCRLTNTTITDFNPASATTDYKWVSLYGRHNRVDHCFFRGKNHAGTTLVVWLSATPNFHLIDNNRFGRRDELGVNGAESIRVGTSDWSMYDSFTTVEQNLFEECNGEIEIISNKSCGNVYRNNTFRNCQGALTLRHGNRCRVEGNFLFGNGIANTGGIRVIGEDHVIVNNYVSGTKGTGLRAAISVMDGIQDSPLSGYFQVKRATIAFNTLVDNTSSMDIGSGRNSENVLPPLDCVVANNLISSASGPLLRYTDTPLNITWAGNFAYGAVQGISVASGIAVTDPRLGFVGLDGLRRLLPSSPAINAATGPYAWVTLDMDGQPRDSLCDVGADEVSPAPVVFRPLTSADVGPESGTSEVRGELRDRVPDQHPPLTAYPNPFNPETTLMFRVSGSGSRWVKLAIFDILGREVATLVDERKPSGQYAVKFDGANLSSGLYVSRLVADEYVTAQKILRVR